MLVLVGTVVVVVWAQAAEDASTTHPHRHEQHDGPPTERGHAHILPAGRPGARSRHSPLAAWPAWVCAPRLRRRGRAPRALEVASAIEVIASFVEAFDPGVYAGSDAEALVAMFTRIERLGGAGKTLSAARAAEARRHEEAGHRSAAHWLATITGDSVGGAACVLELGEAISSQPGVEDGLRRAKFSPARAKAVSDAATVNPASADELVRSAESDTFTQLKERCARAKAEGRSKADEAARSERLRRRRSCRTWTDDDDGAFCLLARLTPDDGARVKAALTAECDRVFDRARLAGRKDSPENYAADALVALVAGGGAGGLRWPGDAGAWRQAPAVIPKAVVHLRVDLEALRNGRVGPLASSVRSPGWGPSPSSGPGSSWATPS